MNLQNAKVTLYAVEYDEQGNELFEHYVLEFLVNSNSLFYDSEFEAGFKDGYTKDTIGSWLPKWGHAESGAFLGYTKSSLLNEQSIEAY